MGGKQCLWIADPDPKVFSCCGAQLADGVTAMHLAVAKCLRLLGESIPPTTIRIKNLHFTISHKYLEIYSFDNIFDLRKYCIVILNSSIEST
jgi:hypothetical protein